MNDKPASPQIINLFEAMKDSLYDMSRSPDERSVGDVPAPLYKCCSPYCPGFPYRASDQRHPPDICRERDVPAPKRKAKKPPVEIVCFDCKHPALKKNACAWSDPSVGRVFLCQECAGKMLRGFR